MIRIIFDNGEIADCDHIYRIMIDKDSLANARSYETVDHQLVIQFYNGGKNNEGLPDLGGGEIRKEVSLGLRECDGIYDNDQIYPV